MGPIQYEVFFGLALYDIGTVDRIARTEREDSLHERNSLIYGSTYESHNTVRRGEYVPGRLTKLTIWTIGSDFMGLVLSVLLGLVFTSR